jgi:hypothetical protein
MYEQRSIGIELFPYEANPNLFEQCHHEGANYGKSWSDNDFIVPFPDPYDDYYGKRPAIPYRGWRDVFRITELQHKALPKFHGLENEDPLMFIRNFEAMVYSFPRFGITLEEVKIQLFRSALGTRASYWLESLEPDSLTTWKAIFYKFLGEFFFPFLNRYNLQYIVPPESSPNIREYPEAKLEESNVYVSPLAQFDRVVDEGMGDSPLEVKDNKRTSPEAQEEINETPFPSHDISFMTIDEEKLALTNAKEEVISVSFHEETKVPMPLVEFVCAEPLLPPPEAISHLEEEVLKDEMAVVVVEEFVDPFLEAKIVAIPIPKNIRSPGGHFIFLKLVCDLPMIIPKELLQFFPHLVFSDDYSRFRPPKVVEVRNRAHDSYLSIIPTYETIEEKSITTPERRYYNIKLDTLPLRRSELFKVIDYSRFRPPKHAVEIKTCVKPTTRHDHWCHLVKIQNMKVWHDQHLFLDPG